MTRSRSARALCTLAFFLIAVQFAFAQQRREREPNSVYAARRATLSVECEGPIVLKGFSGREEFAQKPGAGGLARTEGPQAKPDDVGRELD